MFNFLLNLLTNGFMFFALHISSNNSFPAPLNAKEENEYLQKMKKGDKGAREKLILHNMRLVAHIIKKYYSNYSDKDDLISIGTIGLIKGINTFNPDKGTRLATYAAKCVENEILMYFRSLKKSAHDLSLEEPIDNDSEGNPLTLMDIISTPDNIADDLDLKIKSEKIAKLVSKIDNEREKTIIVLRYGLNGDSPMTQYQIAKLLGISRSYVSRIEKRVLQKMKKELER